MNEPAGNRDHRLEPLKRLDRWKLSRSHKIVLAIAVGALWSTALVNAIGLVFYDRVIIIGARFWTLWSQRPARRMPGDRVNALLMLLLLTVALAAWAFFEIRSARRRARDQID
jgi:hypothetical protein